MKKGITLLFAFHLIFCLKGQNTFPSSGNVGIGTTSPANRLEVFGNSFNRVAAIVGSDVQTGFQAKKTGTNATDWEFYIPSLSTDFRFYNMGDRLTLKTNGNVGIGTISPSARLHLFNSSSSTWLNIDKPNSSVEGGVIFSLAGTAAFYLWSDNDDGDALKIEASGLVGESDGAPRMEFPKSNRNIYMAESGGNVGIGTTTPDAKLTINGGLRLLDPGVSTWGIGFGVNGDPIRAVSADVVNSSIDSDPLELVYHRGAGVAVGQATSNKFLKVYGTVYSKEVNVTLSIPGPDYVFEKDYPLTSLEELKSYIDQNKHLPEIPSAKEMEENGINLKEMNLLLLKKIEELTLHLIEQNIQMRDDHDNVNALVNQMEKYTLYIMEQQSRIKKLEDKIDEKY